MTTFKRRFLIGFIICDALFLFSFVFFFYGPWSGFRDFWITTSMTTKSHQYLAKWFYSDETIMKVLEDNIIIPVDEVTDTSLIKLKKYSTSIYKNKYEKEILEHEPDELYKLVNVSGKGYNGYLVAIYDPSMVHLATTNYLGVRGEYITDVSKREDAKVIINGNGFHDPNWNSNGSTPHGTVIKDGKIVSKFRKANWGGGFIGFTNDNVLVLGKMSDQEALNMGIRDAVEFGPFLMINGKRSFVKGNGGWGLAPRTVIAQRRDGIVLFLVINGRLSTSIGASMVDLCDIMENYGAYNAANLDGGASSALLINHKIINTPVAGGKDGLREIPTFWVVK